MKKKIWALAFLLTLTTLNTVFAEGADNLTAEKKQLNLQEIVLDTTQDSFILSKANNQVLVTENNSLPRALTTLDDKIISDSKKERKILSRLNLIKGVKFLNRGLEHGIKNIDTSVDNTIKKIDHTPWKSMGKIDEKVDNGIFRLEGVVDKGLDVLDGAVGAPLEAMDKVLNVQVEKTDVQAWLDGDNAVGRCFGARPLFEDHGVTIDSSFLYSPMMKTGGGANGERSGKGYGLFNLGVTVDTEAAKLWKGGTFFALYQKKTGYGLSGADAAMGDYMGFDGWDWRQMNQISEYWYQQKLFDGKVRLKIGKQDVNTDFGYLNSGWDFLNSGFSVIPTTPMPTYPDPAFGFVAEINPKEWLSIRNGIYSRYSNPFNITEIEVKSKIKKLPGRYMLGAWEMSDTEGMGVATGVDPDTDETVYNNFNRNFGAYFNFEQMLYKEKKDDENDMQGLVVFGQFGISPSDKNDMSQYMGGGLHYIGPIPKRDKDVAGLAVGSGRFAPRLNNIGSDYGGRIGSETVVEAFYRMQISPWFYLQPDVQFIMNPSGLYDNSVAIGLRSVITF
jgi:porin